MRLDLHVHSNSSKDGTASPGEILRRCKSMGLDGCAITDHNSVEGALEAFDMAGEMGLVVIRGIEISTSEGHILAYGVSSSIPRGLSIEDTISRIHSAGGIAAAAHPTRFGSGLGLGAVADAGFDAVEVLNGGSSRRGNAKASELARSIRLPVVGGSDAHKVAEIGRAVTVVECPLSEGEVIRAISEGRSVVQGRSRSASEGLAHALESTWDWARRGFRRL